MDTPLTAFETEITGHFDRWRVRVLRYVTGFGLRPADAEEVVQDVFLALHRHVVSGKSGPRLRGWVFRVAHNLSLKRRQAVGCMPENLEDFRVADPAPNPEDQVAWRQRQERLQAVVDALPEQDRQCLVLRAEGLRYREIAATLGISLGGVAKSLARSMARLSAVMER